MKRPRPSTVGKGPQVPRLVQIPDDELIETLVAHGQPRHSAEALRTNGQLRLYALMFWTDVGDAGRGDTAAKERVDYCRESWSVMRAQELISDIPGRNFTADRPV